MTCGIPVLLSPVCIDNKCFIDGGVACNYPLNYCINSGKNPDEILGFKNFYSDDTNNNINNESNLIDFLLGFLFKAVFSTNTDNSQPSIKYELLIDTKCLSLETLRTSLSNAEVRKELFESGKKNTITFIEKLHNLENSI